MRGGCRFTYDLLKTSHKSWIKVLTEPTMETKVSMFVILPFSLTCHLSSMLIGLTGPTSESKITISLRKFPNSPKMMQYRSQDSTVLWQIGAIT